MVNIYIYGAGQTGDKLEKFINKYYENILIAGFIDKYKEGEIRGIPILKLNEVDKEDNIVIPIESIHTVWEIVEELHENGFSNIWRYLGREVVNSDFLESNCKYLEKGYLPHLEMHIMDACNLNCRGCAHYAPIYQKVIPDYNSRMNDVKRVRDIFSYIECFYILGGEPFLNTQIGDYAIDISKIFPDSHKGIITNGLLIPQVDASVLDKIKNSGFVIYISDYEPTHCIIEKIKDRLNDFSIEYIIQESKAKFNLPLSLSENSKYEKCCIAPACVNIYEGKIARCPELMFIPAFNAYYKTNLPEEGIISLYESIDGWELMKKMRKEVPLCDHCIKYEIDWSLCGKKPSISDFSVNE